MSKFSTGGPCRKLIPDSRPMLPGDGAKKHAALRRLKGSLEPVYGLQPATTPMRAPSVLEPVMFWLPAPETLKPGVNGLPVTASVTPESCHPSVNSRVKAFPYSSFGVEYT